MAEDSTPPAGTDAAKTAAPPPTMPQTVDADGLQPIYANFVRVGNPPEELVLDFGLNPSPFSGLSSPIRISQRLVMNYYTAKRLWAALGLAIQRHEQAFGVLETDVHKRVVPPAQRSGRS